LRSGFLSRQHRRRAIHAGAALGAALLALSLHAAHPPATQLRGQGELRWLGLAVYDARLWVAPGFDPAAPERHAFELELVYHRAFRAADISRRSIEEMRRAGPIAPQDAQRWQAQLARVLPDVRPGDRIAGVHLPGTGLRFLVNGRPVGDIEDAGFAARFFAIWLGPDTSEPALRDALLGQRP
jgi:hypothetical protein